ncbi:NAD(P)H-dependent oxidoreductase [Palleronia pelagia]|uniref:NAD(P)H-dependent oxidoreductase n=1 Tax=Palleronia pelagia TaxID=387096 RepID=UPI001BE01CB9|nr:NAD(P)H-dependent oxidoreductase [Palleronia pelagia]
MTGRASSPVRTAAATVISSRYAISPSRIGGVPVECATQWSCRLKAWFDQVVRVNKTFTFDLARGDRPLEPVLSSKTVIALTACGEFGFGSGELNEGGDHLVPHLRSVSRYLGMSEFHHVGVEYQEFADHRHEASKAAASRSVRDLGARLASLAASEAA